MKKKLNITVIIPFKDKWDMTTDCVLSLFKYGPEVKEILLISNNSSVETVKSAKGFADNHKNIHLKEYNHPFNYQKMNNWSVSKSSGKFIMFLNNDTLLVKESEGLIEGMYQHAAKSKVGMTGCVLLYGDQRTIQHAGVYIRPGILADHLYIGKLYSEAKKSTNKLQYPYDITKSRPVTAVTGAVQVIEKNKFESVKGFDERFVICGGDVDLCIRLNKNDYQTWIIGGDEYIIHKESQSRAFKPVPYIDFYYSYKSYIQGYDLEKGDPFLPKITKGMVHVE